MGHKRYKNPRVYVASYAVGKRKDVYLIQGGHLNGLEVHDLVERPGEVLVWLDEVGDLNTGNLSVNPSSHGVPGRRLPIC